MTFGGPSAVYKLNYSRYYFRRCFYRYYFSPYTAHINLAATARINLTVIARINSTTTYYGPTCYRPVRYWAYYYSPPYRRAARSWS